VINKIPDMTPAAQACCGVCRTCTTTNVLVIGGAALAGVAVDLRRYALFVKRRRSE
jgi:hypothetical protein